MKILHVTLEKNWGGGEKQLTRLAQECISANINSQIACLYESKVAQFCSDNNLPYVCMKSSTLIKCCCDINKIIKDINADALHLHDSKAHSVGVLVNLLHQKIPLVVTRRMNLAIRKNFISRFKYNYSAIRKIICVSNVIRDTMTNSLQQSNRLTTIYGIIDKPSKELNKSRSPFPHLANKNLIGFVGSFAPIKNPELFLKAAVKIREQIPNAHFLMIGEGPMRNDLEHLVKTLNLTEDITFTGFLKDSLSAISSLKILMVTSHSEGIPNVILEAQALQVPVVATNVGGISEVIQDHETGILCAPENAFQLAKASIRLLTDEQLVKKITTRALVHLDKFSPEQSIRFHHQVYLEAISE